MKKLLCKTLLKEVVDLPYTALKNATQIREDGKGQKTDF